MPTDLASYNNSWYKPGSKLKRACWYFVNALIFKSPFFPFFKFKISLLKAFGATAGKNVLIKPRVNIKYPWFLHLGNNIWIGENAWIDNLSTVTLGNNVCLSQGAMLCTGNHDFTSPAFDLITREIILEDGVWIGARATVCGGVICRDHAVLSVGSVAVSELESMSVYQGNPAVKIKERIFRN
jgi:putative colanic acid biosynthesis acetyltransferase WcaF